MDQVGPIRFIPNAAASVRRGFGKPRWWLVVVCVTASVLVATASRSVQKLPKKPPLVQETQPARVLVEQAPALVENDTCPADMVLVQGEYCSDVRHDCLHWLDDPSLEFARCGEYSKTPRCIGKRETKRYCIDRYEYTAPGDKLPLNQASLNVAQSTCGSLDKRLCSESEWNFACEGEEMRPYPYGFRREPKCNQDKSALTEPKGRGVVLRDQRAPSDAFPECKSPFGVFNLTGNLDEPVVREGPFVAPHRTALKGGWWLPARNRCRPSTTAHADYYQDIQVGVRCCKDTASLDAVRQKR